MSPTPRHLAEDDLEADVRAMLARRARDVHPQRPRVGTRVIRLDTPRSRSHRPVSRSGRLTLVAAVTVLVVGAAALFVAAGDRQGRDPADVTGAEAPAGPPPEAIWPPPALGLLPPPSPQAAAASYLMESTGHPAWILGAVTFQDDDHATVEYRSRATYGPVTVSTVRVDSAWYVTGAKAAALHLVRATGTAGRVTAEIAPGNVLPANIAVQAELIGTDGTVLAAAEPRRAVMPPTYDFDVPAGATPQAVRLTMLLETVGPGDPDEVLAFASLRVSPG